MIRRTVLALAILAAVPGTLQAQEPIVDSLRWLFERTSGNVMATAELLDESLYSYRPTEDVRTAGEILAHIAFSQFQFCAAAAGERNPNSEQFEQTRTSKESIIDALERGFAYCASVYDRTTDADAGRRVTFLSQSTTAGVLAFNSAHIYEHYGNLVTYMRLNGIVPPSSA